MNYRISPRADKDIEKICDHIAKDSVSAADRLDERIHESVELLARFPATGHRRQEVDDPRYLFWAVGNYLIAYCMEGDVLIVVRVVHGARDVGRLYHKKKHKR